MENNILLTSKQLDELIKLKIELLDIIFEKHFCFVSYGK